MSKGVNKFLKSGEDAIAGGKEVGKAGWCWLTGGGKEGIRAGKGVIGIGAKLGDSAAGVAGTVIGGTGRAAKEHPAAALVILAAILYKPIKMLVDKLRGKRDLKALNTQNQNMSLQYDNNLKRAELQDLQIAQDVAARRQLAAMNVSQIAMPNTRTDNAARVQMARTGGIGPMPPYNSN